MIEPEPPSQTDALESLQRAYHGLRTLMDTILMILLVLTWSVNIFLLKQLSLVRNEVEERQRFIAEYEKNTVPLMSEFLTRLQGFTRRTPILLTSCINIGCRPTPRRQLQFSLGQK